MFFRVPQSHLKTFLRVLQCMHRQGDELFVEASRREGVKLRTLNSSLSAFLLVVLHPPLFFDAFVCQQSCQFKLYLKPLLMVFRNQATMQELQVEFVPSARDAAGVLSPSALVCRVQCLSGIHKVFRLLAEECEILQAVFDVRDELGFFSQEAKFFHECLAQFHGADLASFRISQDTMLLQSFVEEGSVADQNTPVSTSIPLRTADLRSFRMPRDEGAGPLGDVQFSLAVRECKNFLSFAETFRLAMDFFFFDGGSPVMFRAEDTEGMFSCNLVVATGAEGAAAEAGIGSQASLSTTATSSVPPQHSSPLATPPRRQRPAARPRVGSGSGGGGLVGNLQEKRRRFGRFEEEFVRGGGSGSGSGNVRSTEDGEGSRGWGEGAGEAEREPSDPDMEDFVPASPSPPRKRFHLEGSTSRQ